MCRACDGNFPTAEEYNVLRQNAKELMHKWSTRRDASQSVEFISDVENQDTIRLNSGAGWGNPRHKGMPVKMIFCNSDPDRGLLLYIICNLMDYQMKSEKVWSDLLERANDWISDYKWKEPPRKDMPGLAGHLQKIVETANKSGSISKWFVHKIIDTALNYPTGYGNIYRIVGSIFLELLYPPEKKRNRQGAELMSGKCSLLGDWKRLWIIMRGLRRDNSLTRCLFERALISASNGQEAIQYWYNDDYFNPKECQLPVDNWVKENWTKIMKTSQKLKRKDVARDAMQLASRYNVSPSMFDVLFVARNTD